jgi:hypothetical protein
MRWRALQRLDRRLLQSGVGAAVRRAILPLQNMDFALEELQRVARIPSVGAVFFRPMFLEGLNHPYYDPLWAELERLGITAAMHATPGLWHPEWTSHGPFFEKIKDRLVQPIARGGAGRSPVAAAGPARRPRSQARLRSVIRPFLVCIFDPKRWRKRRPHAAGRRHSGSTNWCWLS